MSRQKLLEQAKEYLMSPSASTASLENKMSFLESKGLSQSEIEFILANVELPTTTLGSQTIPTSNVNYPKSSLLSKLPLLVFIVSLITTTRYLVYPELKRQINTINNILKLYLVQIYKKRSSKELLIQKIIEFKCFDKLLELDINEKSVRRDLKEMKLDEGKLIQVVYWKLKDMVKGSMVSNVTDLHDSKRKTPVLSLKEMAELVRQQLYFQDYRELNCDVVKSEIRSLKGMLLSRNNFPGIDNKLF